MEHAWEDCGLFAEAMEARRGVARWGDLHGTTEGVTKPGFRWGRGASTAQEQADTAACCGGGGLASDGVLVPGTRTGVHACAAKQG